MQYLEQPAFGKTVNSLRRERGMSQADLSGEGVSSSYVSRLESGHRAPTPQAVRHIAARLGVPEDAFQARSPQIVAALHAQGVAALEDSRLKAAVDILGTAAAEAKDAAPELLWQVLWNLARAHQQLGDRVETRRTLAEALEVGNTLDSPVLQVKSLIELSTCARVAGDVEEAIAHASHSLALAEQHSDITQADVARTLLALVAAESEAGRMADAARHSEQAQHIPSDELGPLWVRVLWTSATVAVRQGSRERGLELLERALEAADRKNDLLTWGRLRMAAISLRLRLQEEVTEQVSQWFREAETVVGLIGDQVHRTELQAIEARMAFVQGDLERAATLARKVLAEPETLAHQDRMRTEILLHQVQIALGRTNKSVSALREVAERLQSGGNLDLSAEAWKALADALVNAA
ncbi:helix-turn-helix domain-containing protein [Streptomyces sp. NPDC005576]|uniref:helix-turn-helix domain-containing protein n=1 Tax=unclassified Streptomyces TaxID=2593676 RepID=UPI0033D1F065